MKTFKSPFQALLFITVMTPTLVTHAAYSAQLDEIQVYADEINKPGEFTLQMHVNGTPSGVKSGSYQGEYLTNGGVRFSPEFAYGVTRDLELGLYAPEAVLDANWNGSYAGSKVRVKWLPVQPDEVRGGFFAGANVELSTLEHKIQESRGQLELRLISGYKAADWIFAIDPIFDWSMSHRNGGDTPDFNYAVKATRNWLKGVDVGLEYYSDIGPLNKTYSWNQQDNRIYAVVDVDMKPLVFNFGVGYGITDASDRWTVKAIVDIPLK